MLKKIIEIPKRIVLLLIRIYQKLFSLDHSFWARPGMPRVCIYYPSCSEYSHQAIDRFGLIKGGILGAWRILRCNPFSKGGVDDIPKKWP
jgi:uncharacterized protein